MQPVVTSITADQHNNQRWYLQVSEGRRGMGLELLTETAEEAESKALALFIARFPVRLEVDENYSQARAQQMMAEAQRQAATGGE